jgi:hypothetical protein
VDHWLGDEHAGRYGEEVYEEVSRYNDRYYRHFSYLVRKSFDDAVLQFADESIDLLHVDGFHTYEAANHDFRAWLSKVSKGGIILLHDICPKHQDFGVWRLWNEIKAEFADSFEFHHSWGLGIVRKCGDARNSPLTELLFESSTSVQEDLRRHYVVYASHLENLLGRFPLAAGRLAPAYTASEVRVQVFPYGRQGYSEDTAQIRRIAAGAWGTLVFDLPEHHGSAPLRMDPGSEPAFVEIGDIHMSSSHFGDLLWNDKSPAAAASFAVGGTAVIPFADNQRFVVSTGGDPQIMVATPPDFRGPIKLTISINIAPASRHAIATFESYISHFRSRIMGLEQQLNAEARERESLVAEVARIAQEARRITAEKNRVAADKDIALRELYAALDLTKQRLRATESTLHGVEQSLSWKVTKPIRRLSAVLRSGPRQT